MSFINELKRIGMIDSGEPYNDLATKAILDLIELFASQGHSGFSAPYVINAFDRLARFKPLSPLTGEDDECAAWLRDLRREDRVHARGGTLAFQDHLRPDCGGCHFATHSHTDGEVVREVRAVSAARAACQARGPRRARGARRG